MRAKAAPERWAGAVAGLLVGLLVLGPGAGRGFLLSYDMVFVPREPFSAALPGLAPPRAVPADLVAATLEHVIPGDIVQKIILLAVFVIGAAGVANLLKKEPLTAQLAGAVFYTCNPFVAERLVIGQWGLLLGYAGLPWVLGAVSEAGLGPVRLATAMLPAIIGGFAAMTITALIVIPAAVATRSIRKAAVTIGILIAGSLPWLIPSLLHPVFADPAGVAAFAARADTPFGSAGSLLMLGGIWNAQVVPKGYGGALSTIWLLIVLAVLATFIIRGRQPALIVAAAAGFLVACAGIAAPGRALLRTWENGVPAIAILRDAQQFVAPLALAEAIGAGLLVSWAMKAEKKDASAVIYGIAGILAPAILLPGLFWGAAGRLRPATYPAAWLAAAETINASPLPGNVLVLPWATYRAPAWNHGHTMLDPWSRLTNRPVIWNDGTQVGDIPMAPDDPRARALDTLLQGTGPLTAALRQHNIGFVIVDARGAGTNPAARLNGAALIYQSDDLIVFRLPT